jgi:hypothetical protein
LRLSPSCILPALALLPLWAGCGTSTAPHAQGTTDAGFDASTGTDAGPIADAGAPPAESGAATDGGTALEAGQDAEAGASSGWPDSTTTGYTNAPGYPGKLTAWTGGNVVSASGTSGSPMVYSFYDFVPSTTTGGTLISGSHLEFVGCRFQSNDVQNYNVQVTGEDVTFEYSSVVPLVSLAAAPPHPAWPSGSAGLQLTGNGTGYQIDGSDAYEYGINVASGGPVVIDHTDIWGFGNAIVFYSTTATMTVSASWIHDAADAAAEQYHTDGPGYLNGGTPPQNVTITGNTIASIGNTNAIAFQAATSAYMNLVVEHNYLSGFGYTADVGHETASSTGIVFKNNVLATDLPWVFGPIYADATTLFSQPSNTWSGNTLHVLAGTTPVSGSQFTWTAAEDGQYLWPDSTLHTTDF